MTEHLRLIARQLTHLQRMREYLAHSFQRCEQIFPKCKQQYGFPPKRCYILGQVMEAAKLRHRLQKFQQKIFNFIWV